MKTTSAMICLALLMSAVSAQETPVTQNEADVAIKKAYGHLSQVLELPSSKFVVSASKAPITRDQVIARLFAMYEYIRPKIQARVKPATVDNKGIMVGLGQERTKQLKTLVSYGLVSKQSQLVVGPKAKYTPKEFGKILGMFITHALDITMALDPKYSPELMDPKFQS